MITIAAGEEDLKVSICLDCARHPSLKRMIEADRTTGVCAFCCRTDATVRNPDNAQPMVMLVRALIRFYWDEFDYNRHWGGENVLELFRAADNPVVRPFVADEYYDEIDFLLQEPPYPEWDEGVSIYAGFDDGVRMLHRAISRSEPSSISSFRGRLSEDNFVALGRELDALVAAFIADLKIVLPRGGPWFRARTGVDSSYYRSDGFASHIVRKPHIGANIGASPRPGNGRLNRAGHPVLYLGSDPYTALAEIRPHPGHFVSIGGFMTVADLNVADFDPDIALFSANEERLAMYEIVHAFDRLMSTPVTPDDNSGYLITQLLAEVLKARGFQGVQFRSSVSDGINLCIFDTADASFVDGYSEVRLIQSLRYDAPEQPSLIVPERGDLELGRQK